MSFTVGKADNCTRRLPQLPGAVVFPVSYQSSTDPMSLCYSLRYLPNTVEESECRSLRQSYSIGTIRAGMEQRCEFGAIAPTIAVPIEHHGTVLEVVVPTGDGESDTARFTNTSQNRWGSISRGGSPYFHGDFRDNGANELSEWVGGAGGRNGRLR